MKRHGVPLFFRLLVWVVLFFPRFVFALVCLLAEGVLDLFDWVGRNQPEWMYFPEEASEFLDRLRATWRFFRLAVLRRGRYRANLVAGMLKHYPYEYVNAGVYAFRPSRIKRRDMPLFRWLFDMNSQVENEVLVEVYGLGKVK